MLDPKIIEIATDIRKKAYNFAMSDASKEYDFHHEDNLSCMCAVASYALYKDLLKKGYNSDTVKFVEGDFEDEYCGHCWIEIEGFIVDVTATQFGIENEIYITKIGKDRRYIKERETDLMPNWHMKQTPYWSDFKRFFE